MNKTKGQQPLVAKLELLALCVFCGGVAERFMATGLHPADGTDTVRGSESIPDRQISDYTPAEVGASTGAKTAQPKPYRSDTPSMRLLAVELNRRFHSDVPQLQDRYGEGR
jgi:hypothetical protein